MAFAICPKLNTKEGIEALDALIELAPTQDIYDSIVVDIGRGVVLDEINLLDDKEVPVHKEIYSKFRIVDPRLDIFSVPEYLGNPGELKRIIKTFGNINPRAKIYPKLAVLKDAHKSYEAEKKRKLKEKKASEKARREGMKPLPNMPFPSTIKIPNQIDSDTVSFYNLKIEDIDDHLIEFITARQEKYADLVIAPYYPIASTLSDNTVDTLVGIAEKTMELTKKDVMPVICTGQIDTTEDNFLRFLIELRDLNPVYVGLRLIRFDDEDRGLCKLLAELVRKIQETMPDTHLHVFDVGTHGTFGMIPLALGADSFSLAFCETLNYPPPTDFVQREGYYNRLYFTEQLVKNKFADNIPDKIKCSCPACQECKSKDYFYQYKRVGRELKLHDWRGKRINGSARDSKIMAAKFHHMHTISRLYSKICDVDESQFKKNLSEKLANAIPLKAPDFVRYWLGIVQGN